MVSAAGKEKAMREMDNFIEVYIVKNKAAREYGNVVDLERKGLVGKVQKTYIEMINELERIFYFPKTAKEYTRMINEIENVDVRNMAKQFVDAAVGGYRDDM